MRKLQALLLLHFIYIEMGIREINDGIWLATFMDCDLGFFDIESTKFETLANPFCPREPEVEEPVFDAQSEIFRSEPVIQFEFEEIAEPKALQPSELRSLMQKFGSSQLAASALGSSEAFVRQNAKKATP